MNSTVAGIWRQFFATWIGSAVTGDAVVFGSASPSISPAHTPRRTVSKIGRKWEETMARPRAADDFAAIRERMQEIRRERGRWTHDQAVEPIDVDRQPMNRRAGPFV